MVDELFHIPATTITRTAEVLGVTHRAARLNIARLVDAGVLVEVPSRSHVRERRKVSRRSRTGG